MQSWPVQDAKARFSEMLLTCEKEGPQLVTKRGEDVAVVVSMAEWNVLQKSTKPTLKEILLNSAGLGELPIPPRGKFKRRPPPVFD